MKKVLVLLATAVLTAPGILAQEEGGSVRFGIKLSPNMGWLRPDTKGLDSEGTSLGYTFGLLAEFPVGNNGNYAFATGLFLLNISGAYTQDYKFMESVGAPEQTKALQTDLATRYVDIPLTIKMMTNEIGYIRYFGQLGVSTGFNVRAKADFEEPVKDPSNFYTVGFTLNEDEDFQDNTNLFRAGLVIGGGLEYNFSGNTAILAGITYNNGLTNLLSDVEYGGKKSKVFNDYLELTVGVFF
jgi:hypothetical protein